MNKKVKEKLVLDALGVKVGDVVEVTYYDVGNHPYTRDYEIKEDDETYLLESNVSATRSITVLIYYNFIKKKRTKGNLTCSECKCDECPLCTSMCNRTSSDDKLYAGLEKAKEDKKINDKVYSLFKEILDEEIE